MLCVCLPMHICYAYTQRLKYLLINLVRDDQHDVVMVKSTEIATRRPSGQHAPMLCNLHDSGDDDGDDGHL